jgi:predicted HTH transcriptional regulator
MMKRESQNLADGKEKVRMDGKKVRMGDEKVRMGDEKVRMGDEKVRMGATSQKTSQKTIQKTSQKDVQKDGGELILEILKVDAQVVMTELAARTGLSVGGVKYQLAVLKKAGRIRRKGGRKLGYWEVVK